MQQAIVSGGYWKRLGGENSWRSDAELDGRDLQHSGRATCWSRPLRALRIESTRGLCPDRLRQQGKSELTAATSAFPI